jgi:hypothetical protein
MSHLHPEDSGPQYSHELFPLAIDGKAPNIDSRELL